MSGLSRRRVFLGGAVMAGAAALPASALPATTEHPDAELLAACAEFGDAGGALTALFEANDRLYDETGNCDDVPEELLSPMYARLNAVKETVIKAQAKTLVGVVARARALVAASPAAIDPYTFSSGRDEEIARAVIRDLLAVTGGGA